MEKPKLQQKLEELHTELGNTRAVDPAARQLLEHLQMDIRATLKNSNAQNHASLVKRLNAAVTKLEESHPELTKTIKDVLDNLANV